MISPPPAHLHAELFDFLAARQDPASIQPCDLIIGFGHFDPKIPATCASLFRRGLAPRILFTGGIGAGTADLGIAEADFFLEQTLRESPQIPREAILVENRSTNTSENLQFSDRALAASDADATLSSGIGSAILVANAYRQLRVFLTMRKLFPHIECFNAPPATNYENERLMFAEKGQELDSLLDGEITRLIQYPQLGYIAPCSIPGHLLARISHKLPAGPQPVTGETKA